MDPTPSLTDTLCTQCGLCCDGSLFADVELASRAEATGLEILGLEIDDDSEAGLLQLPCAALAGTRCTIYAHRPQTCRTFECRLLLDVRRGSVGMERARRHIAEAHDRIALVRDLTKQMRPRGARLPLAEGCAEAIAKPAGANLEVNRKRAELRAAMSAVTRLIRRTFLADRPASEKRRAVAPTSLARGTIP